MPDIQDWGAALMTSLAAAFGLFFAAIPRLVGFALIIVIGWFIASLIARVVAKLLRVVNFNGLAERSGFSDFVKKMGVKGDASSFVAQLVKWFIRLIALIVGFDALGLPAVSEILNQLLLWLPNVLVALVVLVLGGLAAQGLSNLVRGSTAKAGFTNSNLLGNAASVVVWSFAIVVAVNQLGIAATLVNTLFMGVIGALALASGLAFGLGGRETAAEFIREWRAIALQNRERAKVALEEAKDAVQYNDEV